MEDILKRIQDPEWWFSVVIVGLVVGLAAAYAKDFLTCIGSKLSKSFAAYARRKKKAEERRIEVWVQNPTLLAIEYMRGFFGLGLAFFAFTFSMGIRAWDVLVAHFPEVDFFGALLGSPSGKPTVTVIVPAAFLLLGFACYLRALSRLSECQHARALLNERLYAITAPETSDQNE